MKQREIKFRVWDGEKMWEIDGNSKVVLEFNKVSGWNILPNKHNYQGEYLAGESATNKEFHLMQFTGLTDKNGVDIYEGDLIKNVGTPKLKHVVYHDQAFYLREGNAHTRLSKLNFDGEIIGNIHEHKHLLK